MAEDNESKDPIDAATDKAKKSVGLVETMGCCCLNLGCFFLILAILSLIAMIIGAVSNPMEVLKALLGSLWGAVTGIK